MAHLIACDAEGCTTVVQIESGGLPPGWRTVRWEEEIEAEPEEPPPNLGQVTLPAVLAQYVAAIGQVTAAEREVERRERARARALCQPVHRQCVAVFCPTCSEKFPAAKKVVEGIGMRAGAVGML